MKRANKKQNDFNIYNVVFFKKIKKNTRRYHYQNLDDMIYNTWDIDQSILILVIYGHLLPIYPHKTPQKSKFWKMKYTILQQQSHPIRAKIVFLSLHRSISKNVCAFPEVLYSVHSKGQISILHWTKLQVVGTIIQWQINFSEYHNKARQGTKNVKK